MPGDDVHAVGLVGALDGGDNVADVDREQDATCWLLYVAGYVDGDGGTPACLGGEPAHLCCYPVAGSTNASYGVGLT